MKYKYLIFFAILSIESFSQYIFEMGYFINESNQKTECLIKLMDWINNPTEFEFKLTQDAAVQKQDIKKVKEFGIYGYSKYIRAQVGIDRSSDNINKLDSKRNPVFQEEQLFLKVLIEGEASLFFYQDAFVTRFFYKTSDTEIKQLVYKRFLVNNGILVNSSFKQQLLNDFKDQGISQEDVAYLHYSKKELERFFKKLNGILNADYIHYKQKRKEILYNLSLRPGINSCNLKTQNSIFEWKDTDFDNNLNFRFGIEAMYVLPFNKNKWCIIVEPTYQYYKSEKISDINQYSIFTRKSSVNYHSIEIPVGIRYYFYINSKSRLFVNVAYISDFNFNSSFECIRSDGWKMYSAEMRSQRNYGFGAGYKCLKRYSMEIQYHTSRDILYGEQFWDTSYETVSLIFGYSLFKNNP